jgi:hypothetical protein
MCLWQRHPGAERLDIVRWKEVQQSGMVDRCMDGAPDPCQIRRRALLLPMMKLRHLLAQFIGKVWKLSAHPIVAVDQIEGTLKFQLEPIAMRSLTVSVPSCCRGRPAFPFTDH